MGVIRSGPLLYTWESWRPRAPTGHAGPCSTSAAESALELTWPGSRNELLPGVQAPLQSVHIMFLKVGPRADEVMQGPWFHFPSCGGARVPVWVPATREEGWLGGSCCRGPSKQQGGSQGRSQPDQGARPSREAFAFLIINLKTDLNK